MLEITDISLLELVKHDKDRAFSLLVDSYTGKVFNTCVNLLRNNEDAEDVTQEVFTSIYLGIDGFKGKSKLSTWIYSIALNKSKEFLRSKTRKKRLGRLTTIELEDTHFLPNQIINFNHPGVLLEDKERAKIFFEALDQLSENQKIAFTMHKIEGVSYAEVAEIMHTSISSVESLLFRAKKRLRELLSDYFEKNER